MLNEAQKRAVESDAHVIVCIAGAGSGKTKVLIDRAFRLVLKHGSHNVLCVTFTRKAAAEMRERLIEKMGGNESDLPEIRTLHSWCAMLIRLFPETFGLSSDFTVYDSVDHDDVIRDCARTLGDKMADRSMIRTLWKKPAIQALYKQRLQAANAIDFDQIEQMGLELVANHAIVREKWIGRYAHILVDEYQDTNLAQVAIVADLAPSNLFIVGDPRQSIYRFRGAEPTTLVGLSRSKDNEVISLDTNYRSTPPIVALANRVMPDWTPMDAHRETIEEGSPTVYSGDHQLVVLHLVRQALKLGYRPKDIALLGRTWRDVGKAAESLHVAGIPYRHHGSQDDQWTTHDGRMLARWALILSNPYDDNLVALAAAWLPLPSTSILSDARQAAGVNRTSLLHALDRELAESVKAYRDEPLTEWLHHVMIVLDIFPDYAARGLTTRLKTINDILAGLEGERNTREGFREWWMERSVSEALQEEHADAVQCLTVHGSKGLEWPVVIGLHADDKTFPTMRKSSTQEDLEEEQRVFYVMATRARDHLWFSVDEKTPCSRYIIPCDRVAIPMDLWGGDMPPGWTT